MKMYRVVVLTKMKEIQSVMIYFRLVWLPQVKSL